MNCPHCDHEMRDWGDRYYCYNPLCPKRTGEYKLGFQIIKEVKEE